LETVGASLTIYSQALTGDRTISSSIEYNNRCFPYSLWGPH
jgi:hypothetical protein